MARPNSDSSKGVYKPGSLQEARKLAVVRPAVRLGELERLVLLYASTVAWSFTPSDIVAEYSLKRHYAHANKRVYDAIQRLVKRGFLRKIGRGVYELADDVPPDLLKKAEGMESMKNSMRRAHASPREDKENLSPRALVAWPSSRPRGGARRTVRIHMRGVEGYLELYERLLMVSYFIDIAIKRLESYLVKRLKVSKRRIKELRRHRYLYIDSMVVIGAHGKYKCKSKPLISACRGFAYEWGVDIVTDFELPKVFVKVYTDAIAYECSTAAHSTGVQ